jgi:serine/threonine protein phosphatase PrpC
VRSNHPFENRSVSHSQESALRSFPLPPREPAPIAQHLRWGGFSRPASGKPNEDFYALLFPDGSQPGRREIVIALADGLSADGSARPTIEAVVLGLLSDYYATPLRWSVARALDRLLRAANDWVWAQNMRGRERDGVTAAVSLLVLQDGRYYLAHVGDTRVYRLRHGRLTQLTVDHVWPRRDLRHVLRRAVGLDSHLVVDFADGELEAGDVFLMVTDGVWEVLGDVRMTEILSRVEDPESIARALVAASHERQAAYMGRNDATAILLRVEAAPPLA